MTEMGQFKNLSLLFFIITTLILVNFAGLRGDIEGDYSNYYNIFNESNIFDSHEIDVEPGYYFINRFFGIIGLPFQALIYLMAILSIVPKMIFIRKFSLNFGLSVFIYYCTSFFIFDFIQIRQAVATAIFMTSLIFVQERKFLAYLFCILIAIQFHISALIALPVYFFLNLKVPKIVLYSILGICTFITVFHITIPLVDYLMNSFSLPSFIESKAEFYFNSEDFSMASVKQLALGFLFVFINNNGENNKTLLKNKEVDFSNIFTNLFVIGVILSTVFNGMSELSYRIKWYFFWTESLLLINLVRYFIKSEILKVYFVYILIFLLYGYSLSQMLNEFASRGNYIFPYKTFF
jgi:hypothetical protein